MPSRVKAVVVDPISKSCIYALDIGLKGYIYTANVGFVTIYKIGGGTKGEIESKIVETLTETIVDDVKKVLNKALLSRVNDADDNINDSSTISVSQVDNDIKIVVNGKIVEALTGIEIGDAEDMVVV